MSDTFASGLIQFSTTSLQRPVPAAVVDFANHIAKRYQGVEAILAYGSSLRGVAIDETLIDYYVLTRDLTGVSNSRFAQWGCALLPPNVYYIEHTHEGRTLRAKYAVLPMSLFRQWMQSDVSNPYFWARFCQPTALVHAASPAARQQTAEAVATAITTFLANARGVSASQDELTVCSDGFRATYATELRSEREDRASNIVTSYADYYREAYALLPNLQPQPANWGLRRVVGKTLALLRLTKASFTFSGGADYLAWKIERHSGVKVELTDWQRRHPILAGPFLLMKLRRKGAVR